MQTASISQRKAGISLPKTAKLAGELFARHSFKIMEAAGTAAFILILLGLETLAAAAAALFLITLKNQL